MVRHPFRAAREAVHRAADPARARPSGDPPDASSEQAGADPAPQDRDGRTEDLAAMRAAEQHLGAEADPADRATRTANAYLAARRRRLRRQLEHAER